MKGKNFFSYTYKNNQGIIAASFINKGSKNVQQVRNDLFFIAFQ